MRSVGRTARPPSEFVWPRERLFAIRLRDEVDLDAVRRDLIDAVERTVQPAHASVWLRR